MINRIIPFRKLIVLFFLFIGINLILSCFALSQEQEQPTQVQSIEEDPKTICIEEGKHLFWEQNYSEAAKHLEKCAEMDPDNPEIYYYMAQAYFQQGQSRSLLSGRKYYRQAYDVSDTAIEKYLKVIEDKPEEDHTNNYLQLAYIYQIRSLIPGVDEYQHALDIYQKLLEEKPFVTSAYYHMGWIYYQQGRYQDTIDVYLKYLEPGFKSDFVYYHLGLSYDKIGEKEKAEYYFKLIIDEFPETEMAARAEKELK